MKNTILTKRPHFPQKCSLLPRMPSFLFNRLEKEKQSIFYIQWFWFLQCNLHHIVVGIAIYVYNIIYIYIHTTILSCYYNLDVSRNNTNLILNRCECNFQVQILHFLKNVLHPFMLSKGVFQKKVICQDCTCNYSKNKLTHLNLNLLHASFIFCLQSVAL